MSHLIEISSCLKEIFENNCAVNIAIKLNIGKMYKILFDDDIEKKTRGIKNPINRAIYIDFFVKRLWWRWPFFNLLYVGVPVKFVMYVDSQIFG